MKRSHISSSSSSSRPCSRPAITVTAVFVLLILAFTLTHRKPSHSDAGFALHRPELNLPGNPSLPRFAYLISGTKGDGTRVKRLLQAVYHPRNYYLLHLDLEASDDERLQLAKFVKSKKVIGALKNVMVIGKADLITPKGPTTIASMLHAIAILLNRAKDWDWFVNLNAGDYPLMPQDDILHIFSYLPRDLNFIEHTSNIGWKENQRARPIIIDPGFYHSKKSGVFWAKERRSVPASFKLFMGSASVVLTRSFLEFCTWGYDNLPRTLLMYYTNFLSASEGYFHTVICNNKDHQNTTVNHDLRYVRWDNPPQLRPMNLTVEHFHDMVESGVPFAREFVENDPVLDKIDKELLRRSDDWSILGDSDVGLSPTVSSKRLEKLMVKLLDSDNFRPKQCK